MFAKLFSMLPLATSQDTEGAMAAYVEKTRDVPAYWLSVALQKLTSDPALRFVPTVAQIREASARSIREFIKRSEGKDPSAWNPHAEQRIDVDRWLERGREAALALPGRVGVER